MNRILFHLIEVFREHRFFVIMAILSLAFSSIYRYLSNDCINSCIGCYGIEGEYYVLSCILYIAFINICMCILFWGEK